MGARLTDASLRIPYVRRDRDRQFLLPDNSKNKILSLARPDMYRLGARMVCLAWLVLSPCSGEGGERGLRSLFLPPNVPVHEHLNTSSSEPYQRPGSCLYIQAVF